MRIETNKLIQICIGFHIPAGVSLEHHLQVKQIQVSVCNKEYYLIPIVQGGHAGFFHG